MSIPNSYRALAATAFIALLAGCSGGSSSMAPTGTQASSMSKSHSMAIKSVKPFASEKANALWATRNPLGNLEHNQFVHVGNDKKSKGASEIFLSDNFTGNVDGYADVSPYAMNYQCAGCGGWGLSVNASTGDLAVGVIGGTVALYHVTGGVPAATPYNTCTLTDGGSAYGIAWDTTGGLYATNWPNAEIDHFPSASTAGCGTAAQIFQTNLAATYFVSDDASGLLAVGYNGTTDDVLLESIAPNGAETTLQTMGSLASGTGFPGGMDQNANGDVYVVNQYGLDYEFSNHGAGSLVGECNWGFDPNDYTNLALDTKQKTLWNSDINFGSGLLTYGESAKAKLKPAKKGVAKPCKGVFDTTPSQVSEEYLGVAVWPRGGV
jgi:hypothetical protein